MYESDQAFESEFGNEQGQGRNPNSLEVGEPEVMGSSCSRSSSRHGSRSNYDFHEPPKCTKFFICLDFMRLLNQFFFSDSDLTLSVNCNCAYNDAKFGGPR